MKKQKDGVGDAKLRLDAILRGAFAGPPTKLKDIPTRSGESRATRKIGQKNKRENHSADSR